METMGNILSGMGFEAREVDERARQQRLADAMNQSQGTQNLKDGYDCPKCRNRGYIASVYEYMGGYYQEQVPCSCWKARNSIRRLRKSGLEQSMKRLSDFKAEQPWQQEMAEKAREYLAAEGAPWLYAGGAVGSGKTMLCTAICRELLLREQEVIYMPWVTEAAKIKALSGETEQDEALRQFRACEVLYIDDLFKPVGLQAQPTGADVRIAYDIINYRYINKLRTIVSSEKYMHELMDTDEATGSRIYERCGQYVLNIRRGEGRNWRMKYAGTMI